MDILGIRQRITVINIHIIRMIHHISSPAAVVKTYLHICRTAKMSFLLTEDTATYGHIEPRQPFNWSKKQWGAWELAARYAQLNIDPDSFTHNLADPTVSALRAKSTTVGLNLYLNSNLRITGNFVYTGFTGASPAYRAANHETGLMLPSSRGSLICLRGRGSRRGHRPGTQYYD